MSVKIKSGLWATLWRKKKASTVFTKNQFVDLVSGFVQPSTSSTAKIMGVNADTAVAATDDDYTSTDKIPVLVPRGGTSLVEATVTGTFASTSEGSEFDLSDSVTVDADASTNDPVVCVRYLSATSGDFAINPQIG